VGGFWGFEKSSNGSKLPGWDKIHWLRPDAGGKITPGDGEPVSSSFLVKSKSIPEAEATVADERCPASFNKGM
jgi:hypothetical protein